MCTVTIEMLQIVWYKEYEHLCPQVTFTAFVKWMDWFVFEERYFL